MILMKRVPSARTEDRRFFIGFVFTVLCISGLQGQNETTVGKVVGVTAPPGLMFNKDRKPDGRSQRIIGGHIASPNAYPFLVLLYAVAGYSSEFASLCGGSLLSNRWILTAAHCLDGAHFIEVYLGAHYADRLGKPIKATTFIKHGHYNAKYITNDVALIKLPSNVKFNKNIQPVQLALDDVSYVGRNSRVMGWGLTIWGATSNVLRYVDSKIISNADCRNVGPFRSYLRDTNICTSGQGRVGSCGGDSGGPLMIDGKQVGIVSFGPEECNLGLPSAYSRVPRYISWINTHTGLRIARSRGEWCKLGPYTKVFMLVAGVLRYV